MKNDEEMMIGEVKVEIGYDGEIENEGINIKILKFDEVEIKMLIVEVENFVCDIVEMSIEEGFIDVNKIEINIECSKFEEKLDSNYMVMESDILQEDYYILEKVEELLQFLIFGIVIFELIIEDNNVFF